MVAAFLREEPRASLLPVAALRGGPSRPGGLPHTLRFEPRASQTSALFVARIGKAAAKDALKVAHDKFVNERDDQEWKDWGQ